MGGADPHGWAGSSTPSASAPTAGSGTFGWNSQRHLELYFAAPCTGRVLHTLNMRLFPEQLTYIANHAEDEVVFVDRTVLPLLWPLIDTMTTVQHVVVMDDGGDNEIPDDPRILDYETLLADAEPVDFHVTDENSAASMCYTSGTTGQPQGRRLLAPLDVPAHDGRDRAQRLRAGHPRRRDAGRADVPRQRLGHRAGGARRPAPRWSCPAR